MNPKFRKYLILYHRYVGYFFSVLVIAYCISGVAVNHIDSWNPNFIITKQNTNIAKDINLDDLKNKDLIKVFKHFDINKEPNEENVFYPDETNIEIIISGNETLKINSSNREAIHEKITKRAILHQFNFLHLNNPKKLWTYYADFFSINLLLITLSGLFMKKGKEGFWKKGFILSSLGVIPPVIFLLMYY